MPNRNGTGPLGQGSRTGRGLGNCKPSRAQIEQPSNLANNQPVLRVSRGWNTWLNNLFRSGRGNRLNRK